MKLRHFIIFALSLFLWTTSWICIDWVLNYSMWQEDRILSKLWIAHDPIGDREIVYRAWDAYYHSFILLHLSLAGFIYSLRGIWSS